MSIKRRQVPGLKLALSLIIIFIIGFIVISPERFLKAASSGLSVWAINVLPSVLPFMLFTKLLTSLGVLDNISLIFKKPMKKLFNCPADSSYAFLLSILSGYPVGSKICADLYTSGKITKGETFRMTTFTSNSGPMFILGAVGIGMMLSKTAGYIILISHILGALINGILFRKMKIKDEDKTLKGNVIERKLDFSEIITSSVISILSVGAIIMLFFIVIESLSPIFDLMPMELSSILSGLVEMTRGCLDVSKTFPLKLSIVICSFLISFGGLSTCLQSITLLNKLEMPIGKFIKIKLCHGFLACIVSAFFVLFI